jgi:hypothetical protein
MWRRLKKQVESFRRVPPGQRFEAHYEARRNSGEEPGVSSRVINFVLIIVSFVLGIVFSLVPGIPGFVFFFIGAALLAAESLRVAQFLDASEIKLRAMWGRIARR